MMGYDGKAWLVFFHGIAPPCGPQFGSSYQGKMATRELLWQYANQTKYFRAASYEIQQVSNLKDGQKIVRDLADKALVEIYMWSVHRFHREHEPPAAGLVMKKSRQANQSFQSRLADLRHELRTPIGHIIGYAELIDEDLSEGQRKVYGHDLSAIMGAGQKMLSIIDQHFNAQKSSLEGIELAEAQFSLRMQAEPYRRIHRDAARRCDGRR